MNRFASCLWATLVLMGSCSLPSENVQEREVRRPFQTLSVAISDDPSTLDPRKARDLSSKTVSSLLFEGLMRLDMDGNPAYALAESHSVSADSTEYTFRLRSANWSNGDPVTAYDFEYSWKRSLSPSFPAGESHQLYVLKNGRRARKGEVLVDEVGVVALDEKTLMVTLEKPIAYFLQLLTLRSFYPVCQRVDEVHSRWALSAGDDFVCNGPFILKKWDVQDSLIFARSKTYWDEKSVALSEVQLQVLDPQTALMLFESGAIDWVGSPLGTIPMDAISGLREMGLLETAPVAATAWYRVNVNQAPFNNEKIRRAFALAIDRESITQYVLQGGQIPALKVVPPTLLAEKPGVLQDNNPTEAKRLMQEGLEEEGLGLEDLPPIYLLGSDKASKTLVEAVQEQWSRVLGVWVGLEFLEKKVFWDRLGQEDYQLAVGSWYADIGDPVDFLSLFRDREGSNNNTGWEDPVFRQLLDMAERETEPRRRRHALALAEKLLVEEVPIIPLYFPTFTFLRRNNVRGAYVTELGTLELKDAYIEPEL